MDNGQYTGSGYGYSVGTEWRVAGTGDFNGYDTSHLWRNDSGILTDWLIDIGDRQGPDTDTASATTGTSSAPATSTETEFPTS